MSNTAAIYIPRPDQTEAASLLEDQQNRRAGLELVPVLPTKLKPRTPNRAWVERTGLISRLEEGAGRRLTLVSAPAGFGKTCLVSQWVHLSKRKFAWLTLDEHDQHLDVFVRCLVAALRTQAPGFAPEIDAYLRGTSIPGPGFLADIVARCADSLSEPIWLVLDDYHSISIPEADSLFGRLLEGLPAKLRLVLLSRKNLPRLPKRYFVQNWISEFRTDDLCFSLEETRGFFQRAGCEIDKDTLAALHAESGGWVAGLQLVQLSLMNGGGNLPPRVRRAAQDEGRLFNELLVEEVISRQSPEIQRFLAVSSMFDRFCAPLCDAVLSPHKPGYSSQIIQYLRDSNLFVVSLDSEGKWFRYHHLFSEAVRSLPQLLPDPKQLPRLRRAAAGWFAEQKLVGEALDLYLNAGDIDTAVTLLEQHLHALIKEDVSRRSLERFLDKFPPGAENKYPALLVARAFCLVVRMGMKRMMPILDRAERMLRGRSKKVSELRKSLLKADIEALRSFCCFWLGNPKGAIAVASRVLRSAPRERYFSRGMAALHASMALSANGREDLALRLIGSEMAQDCEEGFQRIGMLMTARSVAYYWSGKLDLLSESGIEMEEVAKSVQIPSLFTAYGTYFQARAALEKNDLNAAEGYYSQLKTLQYQVLPRVYACSLVGLAMVAVARDDYRTARKYASSVRKWALETREPDQLLLADSLDARLALLSGRTPGALHGNPANNEWIQPWLVLFYLTRLECAVHMSSAKQCAQILPLIEKALRRARQFHCIPQIIPILTVKAMALWRAGRRKAGLEVLRQALLMGEPRGFVRTFVDRAPLMRELLQALLKENPKDEYVAQLIAVHSGTSATGGTAADRSGSSAPSESAGLMNGLEWERLSNREVDVLEMLSERLSNKEIAQRLFVTPETTKKHAANIYQKLRVHGRREAVEVAKKLHLLPSA